MHQYCWLQPRPARLQKQRSLVASCLEGPWCKVVLFPVSSCTSEAYTSTALFAGDVKAFCAVQVFYIKLLSGLAGFPLAPSSWERSMAPQSHYSWVCHESLPPSQRELRKSWYSSLVFKEMLPKEELRRRGERDMSCYIYTPAHTSSSQMYEKASHLWYARHEKCLGERAVVHQAFLACTTKYGS